MDRKTYRDFEGNPRSSSYRNARDVKATRLRTAFLNNIGLPQELYQSDHSVRNAVDDFVTHVLLNISWYQDKAQKQYYAKMAADGVVVAVVMVATALSIYMAYQGKTAGGSIEAGGSVATSLTAILAMLKFVSEAHDFQKYRSNFWEAAAALKGRLYTLESDCSKKPELVVLADKKTVAPGFVERLTADVQAAHGICKDQQDAYYRLLAEPSALLGSFSTTRATLDSAARDRQVGVVQAQLLAAKNERLTFEPPLAALRAKPTRTPAEEAELNELAAKKAAVDAQIALLMDLKSTF